MPVGVEYLAGAVAARGHDIQVCDLTFSEDPAGDIASALGSFQPRVVGFSVRNIDGATSPRDPFFLDEIKGYVERVREDSDAVTVAGGCASLCAGAELRDYLGADYLVRGPGEDALPALLDSIGSRSDPPGVLDGWRLGPAPAVEKQRGRYVDYAGYMRENSEVGVLLASGCDGTCSFCVERCRPLRPRPSAGIVAEIVQLQELGVRKLFFCDSELDGSRVLLEEVLGTMRDENIFTEWSGCVRYSAFDAELAELVAGNGCRSLMTMAATWDIAADPGRGEEYARFISACRAHGISVEVELITGRPGESRRDIEPVMEILAAAGHASICVSPWIRLYAETPITVECLPHRGRIVGRTSGNPGLLEPVYYVGVDMDWLDSWIRSEPSLHLVSERAL